MTEEHRKKEQSNTIHLCCFENENGSYNAFVAWPDGQQLLDYKVADGSCKEILSLYKKIERTFEGITIQVNDTCSKCIFGGLS